ncbi:hypothetical protein [Spongiivirga citrea]|uniref:DUF3575 domain-containing protein n=1 Tax=Spongiivirga citrea TaxID=1481457 RepID=A0A6M0CSV0_9FLAO|nr:hypothetical protein [Spongiivirga citrea]NER18587.1 hypothetical protein [Spongiivirga citrea]
MKKTTVLLALIISQFAIGQDSKNVADSQFKINFLTPGVEFETGISNNSTLNFALGTGIFLRKQNNQDTEFGVFPYLDGQYRYYYNFKRRLDKGKRTDRNSANYFSLSALAQSGKSIIGNVDFTEDYAAFVGPIWGMQRTYNSGFNLNLSAGVGYAWSENFDGEILPTVSFTLGWVLGGKK